MCIRYYQSEPESIAQIGRETRAMLTGYSVTVRNEHTGESTTLTIQATCPADAQLNALLSLFKANGWRKALALPATPLGVTGEG